MTVIPTPSVMLEKWTFSACNRQIDTRHGDWSVPTKIGFWPNAAFYIRSRGNLGSDTFRQMESELLQRKCPLSCVHPNVECRDISAIGILIHAPVEYLILLRSNSPSLAAYNRLHICGF